MEKTDIKINEKLGINNNPKITIQSGDCLDPVLLNLIYDKLDEIHKTHPGVIFTIECHTNANHPFFNTRNN